MDFFGLIKALFTAGTGGAGAAISWAAQIVTVAGALGAGFIYVRAHAHEELVVITVGDAAFWGCILGLFVAVVINLAHRAPAP